VNAQIDMVLRQRVIDNMRALLPVILNREIPDVGECVQLMGELGLRSTTTLELLLGLEENLDIQIDVEDIDQGDINTVGDLADFVASHASALE
jgi:acyl carrier protein